MSSHETKWIKHAKAIASTLTQLLFFLPSGIEMQNPERVKRKDGWKNRIKGNVWESERERERNRKRKRKGECNFAFVSSLFSFSTNSKVDWNNHFYCRWVHSGKVVTWLCWWEEKRHKSKSWLVYSDTTDSQSQWKWQLQWLLWMWVILFLFPVAHVTWFTKNNSQNRFLCVIECSLLSFSLLFFSFSSVLFFRLRDYFSTQ